MLYESIISLEHRWQLCTAECTVLHNNLIEIPDELGFVFVDVCSKSNELSVIVSYPLQTVDRNLALPIMDHTIDLM